MIPTVLVVEKNAVKNQFVPMARLPLLILIGVLRFAREMVDQDPQVVAVSVNRECPKEHLTVWRFVQRMEALVVRIVKKSVVASRNVRTGLLLPPMKIAV